MKCRTIYTYDEQYGTREYVGWYDAEKAASLCDLRDQNHEGTTYSVTKGGTLIKRQCSQWGNIEDTCEICTLDEVVSQMGIDHALNVFKCFEKDVNAAAHITAIEKIIAESEM